MLLPLINAARRLFNDSFKRCNKPGCWSRAVDGTSYCSQHQNYPFWHAVKILAFVAVLGVVVYAILHATQTQ